MIILMAFLGSFGAVGLLSNAIISDLAGSYPQIAIAPVLLGSLVLGFFITNRVSGLIARLAPATSTAINLEQLVGRVGTVVSHTVSESYGRVQVRDQHGSLHTVYAIIREGEPVPDQSEVALIGYDAAQRRFIVRPMHRRRAAP
jgi:membrane protein implicated in regulation of membrane protease activity